MIRITPSDTWQGLDETISGDGVIAITGKVLNLQSGTLSGAAQVSKRIDVRAGEVINVRCLARKVSGVAGEEGRIAISYPTSDAPKNQVKIESENWEKYSMRFAVPITHDSTTEYINLIFRTNNEDGGEFEYTELEVTSEGVGLPTPSVTCMGRITMNSGVPTISDDARSHGIVSAVYSGVILTITTDYTYPQNRNFIPNVFAQHDGQTERNIKIGAEYSQSGNGTIVFVFSQEGTGGAALDMTTIADMSFSFICFG